MQSCHFVAGEICLIRQLQQHYSATAVVIWQQTQILSDSYLQVVQVIKGKTDKNISQKGLQGQKNIDIKNQGQMNRASGGHQIDGYKLMQCLDRGSKGKTCGH